MKRHSAHVDIRLCEWMGFSGKRKRHPAFHLTYSGLVPTISADLTCYYFVYFYYSNTNLVIIDIIRS